MEPENPTITESKVCLNCMRETIGPYCHQCGQKQESRIVSIRNILRQAISEYWSLDNRLPRTLKLLFFKPGELTLRWWKGQRTNYLPPLRLYLSFSVIYFFLGAASIQYVSFRYRQYGP